MTRELPNNVPYAAKMSLIHNFQQCWERVVIDCFEEVHQAFKVVLNDLAARYFGRYDVLKAAVLYASLFPITSHLITTSLAPGRL